MFWLRMACHTWLYAVEFPIRLSVLYYQTHRGSVQALQGVSLQAHKGEVVGLVGESDCGKTRPARAITGVIPHNGTKDVQ